MLPVELDLGQGAAGLGGRVVGGGVGGGVGNGSMAKLPKELIDFVEVSLKFHRKLIKS